MRDGERGQGVSPEQTKVKREEGKGEKEDSNRGAVRRKKDN